MGKTIKLHKKSKPIYKYGINEQIDMLPRTTKTVDIIKHLEKFGVSRNEFYSDRNIPYGSEKSISADRLLVYQQVFECTQEDLVVQPVKATPIRQERLNLKHKTQ